MRQLSVLLSSFFSIKKSVKAKIFVSMLILTIAISLFISLFWYKKSVKEAETRMIESVNTSIINAQMQIDSVFRDVKKMHAIIAYETNSLKYIKNTNYIPPDIKWFSDYYKTLLNLQIIRTSLDRTISGIAIYKANGETSCIPENI